MRHSELTDDTILRPQDVCELFQIKMSSLNRMIEQGKFPHSFMGERKSRRWRFGSIKKLLTNLESDKLPQMTKLMGKYLLSVEDIAKWIGITQDRLRKWIANGQFPPGLQVCDVFRWTAADLDSFLNGCIRRKDTGLVAPVADESSERRIPKQLSGISQYLRRYPTTQHSVYFLIKDGQIVYIGSSAKLGSRIWSHRDDKEFDEVLYVQVDHELMLEIEADYIRIFQPPLNFVGTLKDKPIKGPTAEMLLGKLPCWDLTSVASTC